MKQCWCVFAGRSSIGDRSKQVESYIVRMFIYKLCTDLIESLKFLTFCDLWSTKNSLFIDMCLKTYVLRAKNSSDWCERFSTKWRFRTRRLQIAEKSVLSYERQTIILLMYLTLYKGATIILSHEGQKIPKIYQSCPFFRCSRKVMSRPIFIYDNRKDMQ